MPECILVLGKTIGATEVPCRSNICLQIINFSDLFCSEEQNIINIGFHVSEEVWIWVAALLVRYCSCQEKSMSLSYRVMFVVFFIIEMSVLLGSKILTEYITLNQGAKWHINSIPRIRSKEYSHIIRYYTFYRKRKKPRHTHYSPPTPHPPPLSSPSLSLPPTYEQS